MFALAALHDWEMEALDVKTAFLFRELDKELYTVWFNQKVVHLSKGDAYMQYIEEIMLKLALLQKALHRYLE